MHVLVVASHRPQIRFEKIHPLLHVDVNMVEVIVEQSAYNSSSHERQHQGQDKLLVPAQECKLNDV